MRALAAILILSACLCLHAHQPRDLQTLKNIINCGLTLGPARCLNALTAWRAERSLTYNTTSNLKKDLEQFSWEKFGNSTDDELYSEACDGAEKLLRKQTLSFTMIPGFKLELLSKGNGTIGVDLYKNVETETSRSSKKAKKVFLKIFPFLVIPGLIMSAVLPFMLPALKFLTFGAGMINNMALSGAVFTLLRNNAFNDKYEHKVIYLNKGYQNEKFKHAHVDHHATDENYYVQEETHYPNDFDVQEVETIEEVPLNSNWIKQYYGGGHNVQIVEEGPHIRRVSKSTRDSKNMN